MSKIQGYFKSKVYDKEVDLLRRLADSLEFA